MLIRSRRDAQLPQLRHQVFLRAVALDPVAVGAQQLQVLDVVAAASRLRDDVVNLQVAELERRPTAVAPSLLLAEQHVLVLAVVDGRLDVGAEWELESIFRDHEIAP